MKNSDVSLFSGYISIIVIISIYRKKNKILSRRIFYPYLGNIRQTWTLLCFSLYREKDLFNLISAKFGKLGCFILSLYRKKEHF